MKRAKRGGAATVRPMTIEEFEAFYTAEYPKLVKLLVFFDAKIEEAEDAVQKAMADFIRRSNTTETPEHPAAYVRQAAVNFFIKERQRERRARELQSGHPIIEAHLDDGLAAQEEEQYVEHLLECLTSTQLRVIKLVMDGLSTHEIAKELGKTDGNIRQHLKNGRDRLTVHPEVAPLVHGQLQGQNSVQQGARSTKTQRRNRGRRRSSE